MKKSERDIKEKIIQDNESKYGAEIRKKYGNEKFDASNERVRKMTKHDINKAESTAIEIKKLLIEAYKTNDPSSAIAQEACDLHKTWLQMYYPDYDKEYHLGLALMYVSDSRFKKYYDDIIPGCAEFFAKAITIYCA